jgi:hypothetical protein
MGTALRWRRPALGCARYVYVHDRTRLRADELRTRRRAASDRELYAGLSFADATVVDIVIRGREASAKFSNGETVEFFDVGEAWWIDRVGGDAERDFFE